MVSLLSILPGIPPENSSGHPVSSSKIIWEFRFLDLKNSKAYVNSNKYKYKSICRLFLKSHFGFLENSSSGFLQKIQQSSENSSRYSIFECHLGNHPRIPSWNSSMCMFSEDVSVDFYNNFIWGSIEGSSLSIIPEMPPWILSEDSSKKLLPKDYNMDAFQRIPPDSFTDFFLDSRESVRRFLIEIPTGVQSGFQEFDLGICLGTSKGLPKVPTGGFPQKKLKESELRVLEYSR